MARCFSRNREIYGKRVVKSAINVNKAVRLGADTFHWRIEISL